MIEAGAAVRFACTRCRQIFDVDLVAIATIRGRSYSLLDVTTHCKVSRCRGQGNFIATAKPEQPFVLLSSAPGMPLWLVGIRLADLEPPPEPTPLPPAPAGINQEAWNRADVHERKRLINGARG